MRKQPKRLALQKRTIAELAPRALSRAAGGTETGNDTSGGDTVGGGLGTRGMGGGGGGGGSGLQVIEN